MFFRHRKCRFTICWIPTEYYIRMSVDSLLTWAKNKHQLLKSRRSSRGLSTIAELLVCFCDRYLLEELCFGLSALENFIRFTILLHLGNYELIRFWGQKIKDESRDQTKYGPKIAEAYALTAAHRVMSIVRAASSAARNVRCLGSQF